MLAVHTALKSNRRALTLFCTTLSGYCVTMSKANYTPPSLGGKPSCNLVTPENCQFTDEFVDVDLLERVRVSDTSTVFRFGLPNKEKSLGLSTCACLLAKTKIGEDDVIRPYTPISTNDLVGCFDLLVKNYGEKAKMSYYMDQMKTGDKLSFKHIKFNVKIQAPFEPKNIIMLVGGTGITPMIQALHAILGDSNSVQTNVKMIYGSKVANDILGKNMVDNWAELYPNKFKVSHILSDEPKEGSSWDGLRGYMNKELLAKEIPPPSTGNDLLIFVCGPPPMYNALCGPRTESELTGLLGDMGYSKEQVYKF